jgi:hypothetical protein
MSPAISPSTAPQARAAGPPAGSPSPRPRNVTAAPASTDTARPGSPRGTPGARCSRGSTRSTRWPATSAAPTASSTTRARPEPPGPRPTSSSAASAPTAQMSRTPAEREATRSCRGVRNICWRTTARKPRPKTASRPPSAPRSGSTRARSAATAAAAPTTSDPVNPWMPVVTTHASTRPSCSTRTAASRPTSPRTSGRPTSSATARPARPAAGRWWTRTGSADSRTGGLTGRWWQKRDAGSARRAEAALRGDVGYPARTSTVPS